jgi:hypothetical protein
MFLPSCQVLSRQRLGDSPYSFAVPSCHEQPPLDFLFVLWGPLIHLEVSFLLLMTLPWDIYPNVVRSLFDVSSSLSGSAQTMLRGILLSASRCRLVMSLPIRNLHACIQGALIHVDVSLLLFMTFPWDIYPNVVRSLFGVSSSLSGSVQTMLGGIYPSASRCRLVMSYSSQELTHVSDVVMW